MGLGHDPLDDLLVQATGDGRGQQCPGRRVVQTLNRKLRQAPQIRLPTGLTYREHQGDRLGE